MSKHMDPVRDRSGRVGDAVRLKPPADWGYPSLTNPDDVPVIGVAFRIHLSASGETVVVTWGDYMSRLAAAGTVGEIIGHHGGTGHLLPVAAFKGDGQFGMWQCVVHPVWLEYLGTGDPLGPPCGCPTAQLMTLGCTCGRARRERAAR